MKKIRLGNKEKRYKKPEISDESVNIRDIFGKIKRRKKRAKKSNVVIRHFEKAVLLCFA